MGKQYLVGSLVFLMLLFVTVIFGPDALPLWAMTVFLLLIPVSLLVGRYFSSRLESEIIVDSPTETEKINLLTVAVLNRGSFPFFYLGTELKVHNCFTGEHLNCKKTLFAAAKKNNAYQMEFCSEHIGRIDISLENLRIYDCWGFIPIRKKVKSTASVLVLPKLFVPEVILTKNGVAEPECDTFSPYKSGNDPSETFGIREYEPGDALSRIHWKLTEKYDTTVIREASLPMNESVLILVELAVLKGKAEPSSAVRNSIGEIALSLSHRLLTMGYGHTLVWLASEDGRKKEKGALTVFGINSEEDFPEMTAALLSSVSIYGEDDTVTAYMKTHAQCAYSNIVYISPYDSEYLGLMSVTGRKTQILCNEQEQQGNIDTFCYCTTPTKYEIDLDEILI